MSRHKISARLHRKSARALPKLHRSGPGQSSQRARLSAAILTRTRRTRLRPVAVSGGKITASDPHESTASPARTFPEKFRRTIDLRRKTVVHLAMEPRLL